MTTSQGAALRPEKNPVDRLMRGPDAVTIRAWGLANGKRVGSRGAVSAQLQNEYILDHIRRTGLSVGRLARAVAPDLAQAVADRRHRREQ